MAAATAAAAAELERRVMAAVKASAARGDPPLLQAAEAARCAREASSSISVDGGAGAALAAALVSNLCFAHNTGAMWKVLDQAMASRLVSPLLALALLTPRVVPNRQAQPEAYRLYLELLGQYTVAPVCTESVETKAMLVKSIDDALHLSDSYGFQRVDFGHTVILFVLSVIKILTDCILEDCGLPTIDGDGHDISYAIGAEKSMNIDGKGSSFDRKDEHRECLRRKNTIMTLEVVEKITANKNTQVFLRLVYRNTPENFNILLQRLQLIGALKSKNFGTAHNLLGSLMMNIRKVVTTGHQLHKGNLLGSIVSTKPCSSAARSVFGAGKSSCWIPFDMFMENTMDGRHLDTISSIEALTELAKTLQVLNRATWQETFQALWISALRLIQRDRGIPEGPFPHLHSRLCMLLAIVPLSIASILKEESDKIEGGMVSVRRGELLSSLQVLGQFFGLLSPPPAVVQSANIAARKALVALSVLKDRNERGHNYSKDISSIKAAGNMLHLIVEACIARNLVDTSVYFWPSYVVPVKDASAVEESPWSALMEGSPLMGLKDALMVTPASSLAELEKLQPFAVSGSDEEKLAASKILCGASLLRGWNIQEHVIQMVLKLLSTLLPLDSGSDGFYIHHMPMLHALISGISSIDVVHILSMYGLVPELAAILMPLCEIFGSLPSSDHRNCSFEEASVYSVFSCAFLCLLRLWKFHRPPVEYALSKHGVFVCSEISLDFLLLLRNSHFALNSPYDVSRKSIFQLDPSFQKPVYIDSFPKLRAWYFQNQACIASTLSSSYKRKSILQVANKILKIVCHKMSKSGIPPVSSQSTSSSSMSGSSLGTQDDVSQGPPATAWEVLEAVPFVLETVLAACAHGRLSSRDLITGLRNLADFLPASVAVIVSYFSAEITRGLWKSVMLNGTDWPSPAATLLAVESDIEEALASAGVHINISPRTRPPIPMLPLPIATLISLSITVKMEEFNHLQGIIDKGVEICATSSSWPSMAIIGAFWAQKVRRWHDYIIQSCSETPFTRDKNAVAQLIRSCFSSFLGPLVDGRSCFVADRGVNRLLGQAHQERSPRFSLSPGLLYTRCCRMFPDNYFVCEEILKVVIERARALANECDSSRPHLLKSGRMTLSSATCSVEQIASLAASMLCHAGGMKLVRLLYEQILPTMLLSAGEARLGSAGPVCSSFEGFALAYVLLVSGASTWGVGETSPVYTSVYTSKRQRVVDRHLEFVANVMQGNIELGCGQVTWRTYVICFVGLLVDFAPTWIPEVKLETLKKLASGLWKWHECDLALSLLERGGPKAISTVVEYIL
uniref:Mediator of RNA polymerase II transcription subunit 33A n=1 Tax=Oryza nivara TaxID=4536 RepID=A0A0E0HCD7_ORYNI